MPYSEISIKLVKTTQVDNSVITRSHACEEYST